MQIVFSSESSFISLESPVQSYTSTTVKMSFPLGYLLSFNYRPVIVLPHLGKPMEFYDIFCVGLKWRKGQAKNVHLQFTGEFFCGKKICSGKRKKMKGSKGDQLYFFSRACLNCTVCELYRISMMQLSKCYTHFITYPDTRFFRQTVSMSH